MANRYWRGGTGTWNTTTTTNWSATSGGAGGASVPTAADSVFFDQAGTYTVTMTGAIRCLDLTVSAGTVTFAQGTSPALIISSNWTLNATTNWSSANAVTLNATTSKTITTNGASMSCNITLNGVGGSWTLGSALTTSGTLSLTAGTFDTSSSGNYSLSVGTITASSANTAVMNLNASTVSLISSTALNLSGAGLTFNAGTSQINRTSGQGSITITGARTFYNFAYTAAPTASSSSTISGSNTFNNLAFTAPTNGNIFLFNFADNQRVNGNLTLSGGSAIGRLFFLSDALGTARTLTLANSATLTNCDFRDITAATNAITATGGGNCGGNTNITGFPAAKTVYWNLSGLQFWYDTGWATSSGGTPALGNFPLAQDTAIFDNAGAAGTVDISNSWNIGTLDMSARTSAMTLTNTIVSPAGVYGNWSNGTGVTLAGTSTIPFSGRGNTQQITSNGVAFTQSINVQNIGGTVRLMDAFTTGIARTLILTNGTLDLQSYTLTTGRFSSANVTTRAIAFGTGNITIIGTGLIFDISVSTGFTVTGTPVINVSNNTATAATVLIGSLSEANSISFNFTVGTYVLSLTASGLRGVDFTGYAGTLTLTGAVTVFGNLVISTGMTISASVSAISFSSTSGTKTITTNGKTLDLPLTFGVSGGAWQLQDALTMGATRTLLHASGTLDLNGKTLTVGASYTTTTGTKNLTFNGGTLVCPAASTTAFNNNAPTNFTTTAGTGTGTISMTAATAKTFVGGGSTFNCTLNQGGAGTLTITGANTFNNITNTVQPATVLFTAATTSTFNNFNLNGTAGNLVTIGSVTASSHTLSKASGTVSGDYLSISRSTATGGAAWYAGANSTDGGNNLGWIFTAPPIPGPNSGSMFLVF